MSVFFDTRAHKYDTAHVGHLDGGIDSKHIIASFLPNHTKSVIDLGIGTGLELEAIFKRFPDIEVTGLDIAGNMLQRLRERYLGKNIRLYQESYLDFDLGRSCYDAALSVMTLHHYSRETKVRLYRRIYDCIKRGGVYIECDYMLTEPEHEDAQALEAFYFSEFERLKKEQGLSGEKEYHYDTPCTVATQLKLLLRAGFSSAEVVKQWKNSAVIRAGK
jgi:tRNA (cmo5U34)-methyltransferase